MIRQLSAALILGGLATLGFGSLVPLWLAAPVVVVCAVGIAFALGPRLTRGLTTQIEREREFSANASHQLKTPLAALRFRLDDLTLWPETATEVKAELIECMAEVDRLTGTVEDLLSLARDGAPASTSAVDLADAAASAVGRWRRLFGEKERELSFSAPPEPVLVTTAPRPMLQVIDVLLENALSHGAGTTKVHVELATGRGLIMVADEGNIDPKAVDRIFDRSFRSATSAGSGIGLALARTIVDTTGGRLVVAALSPTCFELSFPLA
jgi:signal transduction histidine kinase